MISKEDFIKVITKYQSYRNKVDQISSILGTYFLDSDWMEYPHFLFQDYISSHFGVEGADWINWWLFEKPLFTEGEAQAWDENHNEIPTDTVDDLWNIVENHRLNDFGSLNKKE